LTQIFPGWRMFFAFTQRFLLPAPPLLALTSQPGSLLFAPYETPYPVAEISPLGARIPNHVKRSPGRRQKTHSTKGFSRHLATTRLRLRTRVGEANRVGGRGEKPLHQRSFCPTAYPSSLATATKGAALVLGMAPSARKFRPGRGRKTTPSKSFRSLSWRNRASAWYGMEWSLF
jgi:hypothetical protein